MKNYIYLLLLLLPTIVAQAQQPKDKIEQYRIAFITKEVDLTVDEAKLFWPLYNKYRDELEAIRASKKVDFNTLDMAKISEEEAEKKAKEIFAMKQSELDIQKKYYVEFKKVITAKKALLLIKADADFKKKLVELLQQKKPNDR